MPSPNRTTIAIIGAGPRGTSLIERIGANLRDHSAPFDLLIIDDSPSGAGRIWRADQTRELCMNTLSHAVTLFTEPSSTVDGPIVEGPTLYEWSILALHAAFPSATTTAVVTKIPSAHLEAFDDFPAAPRVASAYREELESTLPESHPSRALYGEYLSWCYERALARLPDDVRVIRHRARAVSIAHDDARESGRDVLTLSNGTEAVADATILATGWMPRTQTATEEFFASEVARRDDLVWVRPASPVEQPLDGILPHARVIVRGLGMGFFDTMALLTIGRGGEFVPDPATTSGLRYIPSGREPILHATSHRGVPFRAKTLYRSLPPSPPQRFALGVDWSKMPRPIDFDREFWPRVIADAFTDHAETLLRVRPSAVSGGAVDPERARASIREAISGALDEVLAGRAADLDAPVARIAAAVAPFIHDPADRLDLLSEMHPAAGRFASPEAFDDWVVRRTSDDLAEAELGRESAVKAGLWSVSAARAVAAGVGTAGGFDAESRDSGYALLTSLGGMVGSGPPAFRSRQLLALCDAGLVHFIGPAARVRIDEHGFTAESPSVAGSKVTTHALIDAWMHFHDLGATADPLARSLLDSGRARPFSVAARSGDDVATAAFDIDPASGRLIRADGTPDPSVHVVGIPVDDLLHNTIISPMPGTDPPMLRETDRVARSALSIIRAAPGSGSPFPVPSVLEGALNV